MMNLFYYMYYRLEHFYRRYHDSEPSSSAYCALCAIQSMTIAVLCVIYATIYPQTQIIDWILSHSGIVLLCQLGIFLIQYTKFRNIDKTLEEKWNSESPKQRRIRKYLLIAYTILMLALGLSLPFFRQLRM